MTTTVTDLKELPVISTPSIRRNTQTRREYFFLYDITDPASVMMVISNKPFETIPKGSDKIQLMATSAPSAIAQASKTVRSQFRELHSLSVSTPNILIHVQSTFPQVLHVSKEAARTARRARRATKK